MTDLLLPFGERVADGRMVRATEVVNGLACGCVCPKCRRRLVAKQGLILQAHFAHEGEAEDCVGAFETMVHRLAKQIIADGGVLRLPPTVARYKWFTEEIAPARSVSIRDAKIETRFVGKQLDVMVQVIGEEIELAVEIFVTHHCTPEKLALFEQHQLPAIEIDLSKFRMMTDDTDLAAAVLDVAPRSWLYPTQREADAELAARTEARWAVERERQAKIAAQWAKEQAQIAASQHEEQPARPASPRVEALAAAWRTAEDNPPPPPPHFEKLASADRDLVIEDWLPDERFFLGVPPFRPGWQVALMIAARGWSTVTIPTALRWLSARGYVCDGLGGFVSSDEAFEAQDIIEGFKTPFFALLDFVRDDVGPFIETGDRRWSLWRGEYDSEWNRWAHDRRKFTRTRRLTQDSTAEGSAPLPPLDQWPSVGVTEPPAAASCQHCAGHRWWNDGPFWCCARCVPEESTNARRQAYGD
jgi:hypothetical protein